MSRTPCCQTLRASADHLVKTGIRELGMVRQLSQIDNVLINSQSTELVLLQFIPNHDEIFTVWRQSGLTDAFYLGDQAGGFGQSYGNRGRHKG